MRKFILILVALLALTLVLIYYPAYAEKPAVDGEGPLAIVIDPVYPAPEYHSPLSWWQTHHFEIVNRGDVLQEDCLYCHDPATSCNNCHDYVGAPEIIE